MSVTVQDVEYIAKLAKLEYSEEEKIKFTKQFNTILGYIDKLNELNTDDIEPLSHVIELSNVFREDEVKPSIPREEALKNAPSHSDEFFKVPKVIPPR
jgi:aspartyl-tRNA(Asn)/glutamyl-tRNA(Gln) amidotransferase subunit C